MKRGQATIIFFMVFALIAVFFLIKHAGITGQPVMITQILPKAQPTPKTQAEICILQFMKEADKCIGNCESDNRNCKSSTDYCNQAHNYCKANCGDGFLLRVRNCMKGMGVLI